MGVEDGGKNKLRPLKHLETPGLSGASYSQQPTAPIIF